MSQLSMSRGDTRAFTITVTLSGVAQNITGCSIVFTATNTSNAAQTFTCSTAGGDIILTNPTAGIATLTVQPAKTTVLPNVPMLLQYSVVLTDTLGNVTTTERGSLQVTPNY